MDLDRGSVGWFTDGFEAPIRMNDGAVDPDGRVFWSGTIGQDGNRDANLYSTDENLSLIVRHGPVTTSNGLAWSADGTTMYYIDTGPNELYAFNYDRVAGSLENCRRVRRFEPDEGRPDGMTIDVDGNLWIAFWEGSCVRCLSPAGQTLAQFDVRGRMTTACAFGGPNLSTLFVTVAARGCTDDELQRDVHAGGVIAFDPGVCGRPEPLWKIEVPTTSLKATGRLKAVVVPHDVD